MLVNLANSGGGGFDMHSPHVFHHIISMVAWRICFDYII